VKAERDHIGFDAVAWVTRLREVNRGSSFTASERALIEERLATLQAALCRPIPFVEERGATQ